MGAETKIEWCRATWSPWEGCTKIAVGCQNCYAADRNRRFHHSENWGVGAPRRIAANWKAPLALDRRAVAEGQSLRIFPSICDPFDAEVTDQLRHRLFVLIHATQHLTWLLLTKRTAEALRYLTKETQQSIIRTRDRVYYEQIAALNDKRIEKWNDPLPRRAIDISLEYGISHFPLWKNIQVGVSVSTQADADAHRETFRAIPVPVKFVSYEPSLGLINWKGWEFVQQIIDGGESGPNARPAYPGWFRATRDFCVANGIAYFHKQNGEWVSESDNIQEDDGALLRVDLAGKLHAIAGDAPDGAIYVRRAGKTCAGRLLDGREWNEFPSTVRHANAEQATAITEPARPGSVPATDHRDVPSNGSSTIPDSSPTRDGEAAANVGAAATSEEVA